MVHQQKPDQPVRRRIGILDRAFVAYDQDLWAKKLHYRDAQLADVLEQFAVMRAANVRLANQLTAEDFRRTGIHTERGAESVGYTLRLLAGHDLVHLDQLARIRRAVK